MNTNRTRHISLISAAIFCAAGGAFAATIKDDADVFGGRDKKLGQLHAGDPVTVLSESGDWMKVRCEKADGPVEGFVKRELVDQTAPAIAPTTAVAATVAPQVGSEATNAAPAQVPEVSATNAPEVAQAPAGRAGPEIALGSHWQLQTKSGSQIAGDFLAYLRNVAAPKINLVADKNYVLYKGLYFMMPLADALKQFGQASASSVTVNTPGFPVDSFKACSFDPQIDGVTKMTLVADIKNQLVAVQLTDTGQKDPWLAVRFSRHENYLPYSESTKLYDILLGRAKGTTSWRVGAIMERTNGVVRIQTELVTGNPELSEAVRSKERVTLFLPQPVADLCSWLLQNRK